MGWPQALALACKRVADERLTLIEWGGAAVQLRAASDARRFKTFVDGTDQPVDGERLGEHVSRRVQPALCDQCVTLVAGHEQDRYLLQRLQHLRDLAPTQPGKVDVDQRERYRRVRLLHHRPGAGLV